MQKEVKKDILNALKKIQPLLKSNDIARLKSLSNSTIHNAGIFQDPDSISISVIIFSLAKIFNRPRLEENPAVKRFKEEEKEMETWNGRPKRNQKIIKVD